MTPVAAVFYREYRQRLTNGAFVFWDLFVPVAYLLLFGVGFERTLGAQFSIAGVSLSYAEFFLAGVLAMTTFGVALNNSWGIFTDKDSGIFYELLTYPLARREFLLGKIGFNVLLAVIGALLAILLGMFALEIAIHWARVPLSLVVVAVTTAGWFFFFSILAVKMARMDSFNTLTSAAYIVLMFLSSLFYPLDELPSWFRALALINPMTWQVDVLRFTLQGVGAPARVIVEAIAFAVFALVCLWLADRAIDRAG